MCELCARVEDRSRIVERLPAIRHPEHPVPREVPWPEPPRETTLQVLMRLAATWAG